MIVPQPIYPARASFREDPLPPVTFSFNGRRGVPIALAYDPKFNGLSKGNSTPFSDVKHYSMTIRMMVRMLGHVIVVCTLICR